METSAILNMRIGMSEVSIYFNGENVGGKYNIANQLA